MLARVVSLTGLLLFLSLQGCSSRSGLANSATDSMGDWSPVGSQQVTRHKQFTLASHYHLAVAAVTDAEDVASPNPLHERFASQLARQLRRYFIQVDSVSSAESQMQMLASARTGNSDILLLVRVQSWPDIDPVRLRECENNAGEKELSFQPCDAVEKDSQGEMALTVMLYDVRAGALIDSVFAHSRRGVASFVYEDSNAELEQLCKLIVGQLIGHGDRS